MFNNITEYAQLKLSTCEKNYEASMAEFTADPTGASRFGHTTDIVLLSNRIKWYEWLLESHTEETFDVKRLIGYVISNLINNENKEGWETAFYRSKLTDLYIIGHNLNLDLGDFAQFHVNV